MSQAIIKYYRFGGTEFPPVILFKIYTQVVDGNTTKYINGKNSIKPATSVNELLLYNS